MKHLKILFPLLIILFVISCTKKSNEYDISFQELSFANDILATISILNDSVYVVGGEDGEIYLQQDDSVIADYKPDLARIYCLFIDNDTLYAGVRNSGIVKLVKNNAVKQYNIPQKETRYSPYNIIPYRGDTLLTTTSNGLYYFSKGKPNNLSPIQYVEAPGEPFPFCSPITIGNNIFVGSKKGIIKINTLNDKPKAEPLFNGKLYNKVISKIEKKDNDTIYALSDDPDNDTLYVCNIKSDNITKSYGLSFSAHSFVIAEDKFYFVNEHELHVITNLDDMGNREKEGNHVVVRLPHISSSNARNIIIYDKPNEKIRIITQKALLSLPSVNGIGESKSQICGICFDEKSKTLYFQNANNEIFKYKYDKGSEIKALKIIELPSADEISSLSAYDETLYFISNHQQLKSIKDRGYLQTIWSNKPDEICNLPDKSTTMFVDDSYAYVGVRDTLLRISLLEKTVEPIVLGKDVKPYVTNIKKNSDNKNIYASTLNDGLFVLDVDTLSPNVKFQNDFAFTDNGYLLLNNHYLRYYLNDPKDSIVDSVALRGYERLFFNNEKQIGAVINKNAIQFFQIDSGNIRLSRYKSRPITPQACMIVDDSLLFLAADEGMLVECLSDSLTTKPVNFDHSYFAMTESLVLGGSLFFIVLFISIIILIRSHQRKLRERDNRIQEEKRRREEDYRSRVQGLIQTLDYIEDNAIIVRVRQLETEISSKDIVFNEELNKRIQKIAQQVAIGLVEVINLKQLPDIERIDWAECETVKKKCLDCIASKDTYELLERIKDNKKFLERVKYVNDRLLVYENLINNGVIIEGATSGLGEEIIDVKNAFQRNSLKIAEEKFAELEKMGNALNSGDSIKRIRIFVDNLSMTSSSGNTIFETYVSEQLDKIKDRLSLNPSGSVIEGILIEIKSISNPCELRKILFDIYSKVKDLSKLFEQKERLENLCKKNEDKLRNHDNGIKTLRPEDWSKLKTEKEKNEKDRKEIETKIAEAEKERDKFVYEFFDIIRSLNNEEIDLIKMIPNLKSLTTESNAAKILVMLMAVPREREKCSYQQYTGNLYNYWRSTNRRSTNHSMSEHMSRIKRFLLDMFNNNQKDIIISDKTKETLLYKLLEDCWNKVRD